jgi:FkbM family methyltransferase
MKTFLRRMIAGAGYNLIHRTEDPVLNELDLARSKLRLQTDQPAQWLHTLSQLALSANIRDLLRLHRPDLVIDVGANHGQFAHHVRMLGYRGPILSLEPQRALAEQLRTQATTTDSTWTVVHGAAGDAVGELVLQTYADDSFSSFHPLKANAQTRFGSLVEPRSSETVCVKPIDAWLADTPHAGAARIFLKTDTQGHDLSVLRGATGVLGHSCMVLAEGALIPLYETVATPEDLRTILTPHGFRLAGTYAVSHDDKDLAALELDCLFTRTIQ